MSEAEGNGLVAELKCLLLTSSGVHGVFSLPFRLLLSRAGQACPDVPAALFSGQEMAMGWKLGNPAERDQKGL